MINVTVLDFKNGVPEVVSKNEDGSYSVFLNARLTYERRLEAYAHALRHIENGDFNSDSNVGCLEKVAHQL